MNYHSLLLTNLSAISSAALDLIEYCNREVLRRIVRINRTYRIYSNLGGLVRTSQSFKAGLVANTTSIRNPVCNIRFLNVRVTCKKRSPGRSWLFVPVIEVPTLMTLNKLLRSDRDSLRIREFGVLKFESSHYRCTQIAVFEHEICSSLRKRAHGWRIYISWSSY